MKILIYRRINKRIFYYRIIVMFRYVILIMILYLQRDHGYIKESDVCRRSTPYRVRFCVRRICSFIYFLLCETKRKRYPRTFVASNERNEKYIEKMQFGKNAQRIARSKARSSWRSECFGELLSPPFYLKKKKDGRKSRSGVSTEP